MKHKADTSISVTPRTCCEGRSDSEVDTLDYKAPRPARARARGSRSC